MRKYVFLVHPADYGGFLEELRASGVLHVQQKKNLPPQEEMSEQERRLKEIESALKLVSSRKKEKETQIPGASAQSYSGGPDIARRIWAVQEELEGMQQQLHILNKELNSLAPWGEFSLETLHRISRAGWECSFYTCPIRKFQPEWEQEHALFMIRQLAPDAYFVVLHRPGEQPELDAEQLPHPLHDPAGVRASVEEVQKQIADLEQTLDDFAANLGALETVKADLQEHTDREQVIRHTGDAAEGAVLVLEGFVPRPVEGQLKAAFENRPIVFWPENPVPEDHPPVLLKNGRFARFFEPISKLFALPSYGELDLTPFFAPFFMLFFGFCLGDAGYGVVILVGTLLYRSKAKEEIKPFLTLAHFLGAATILFGILTGTVFGINLLQADYAWIGNARSIMIDSQQAFNLALILGLVQTLFGLVLQAVNRTRQYSFAYGLPPVGWILLLLSLLDIGLLKMAAPYSSWTAWAGVGLIVFFSMPKGHLLSRLGKGLWDLYGITGFFGDLLSYVRLFALGISSAILGFVINDIALQMKGIMPVLGPILFVLFLIVGHGANLLISSLGSFVHPMRLTFVEFYKNAGFDGGGKAYEPFASRKKQQNKNIQNV
jgi:V/A-type H+/Na+-transporting ATPase subunit I